VVKRIASIKKAAVFARPRDVVQSFVIYALCSEEEEEEEEEEEGEELIRKKCPMQTRKFTTL